MFVSHWQQLEGHYDSFSYPTNQMESPGLGISNLILQKKTIINIPEDNIQLCAVSSLQMSILKLTIYTLI